MQPEIFFSQTVASAQSQGFVAPRPAGERFAFLMAMSGPARLPRVAHRLFGRDARSAITGGGSAKAVSSAAATSSRHQAESFKRSRKLCTTSLAAAESATLPKRQYAVAAAQEVGDDARSSAPFALRPVDFAISQDDEAIRAIFDQPEVRRSRLNDLRPTGLFLHPRLTHPAYLQTLTEQTLVHASHVVDRIISSLPDFTPSFPGSPFTYDARRLRDLPKSLDRLSDILCLVIDMSELIRNTHPDEAWVIEAERAYERLGSFMNSLNTNQDLYRALKLCLDSNDRFERPLSLTELQLIDTFMKDFEKSGIHLPPDTRQRFVALSDEIQVLGRKFLGDVAASSPADPESDPAGVAGGDLFEIPVELLEEMGPQFIRALPKRRLSSARLVGRNSWAAQMILRRSPNEHARRIVYESSYRRDQRRVNTLEELLSKRGELAGVLGKDSWSEVALGDKMAKTPENVMGFLNSLAEHHRAATATDVGLLASLKQRDVGSSSVFAWDRDYYSERYMAQLAPGSRLYPVSPYFSAGTVIQGLSRFFTRLYGIRFEPCEMRPGESWHPDVRKLNVIDEEEGLIGVIFFDLFTRPGKPAHAAHYTVRCSRRIDDDDPDGDLLPDNWDWSVGMTGVEDHAGVEVRGRAGRYQLPLVVLTTDFAPPGESPSLLSWPEVETLFHEMGHAIHCEPSAYSRGGR